MSLTRVTNRVLAPDAVTNVNVASNAAIDPSKLRGQGYIYVDTLYFNTPGTSTFNKADYPWLRAIRAKCQGAGGGGGGCTATGAGQNALGANGGGGAYAETFITDINSLAASVTVTVGTGGAGGAAGENNGGNGTSSSFGALCQGNGGAGGGGGPAGTLSGTFHYIGNGGAGGSTGIGDFIVPGERGINAYGVHLTVINTAAGGSSYLGSGGSVGASVTSVTGGAGTQGGGGSGGGNIQSQGSGRAGGRGGHGVVILELFA